MSQIKVNEIYDASGGSAAKLYGSSMRYGGTAFVNRIINGDMRIDQRNNGASVPGPGVTYTVDRFAALTQSGSGNTFQQVSDAPAGFSNSLKITIGTGAAPTSTQQNIVWQPIEGFNVADLGLGAAGAVSFTASFWVKSSLTGTHSAWFQNSSSTRAYIATFTVSSANTWEYKTVTVVGDTTGTWLKTNGAGLLFGFSLGAGSTLQTTAGSWTNGDFKGATGSVNIVATSGATFQITGVQLEAGSVASPFERRDYGRELIMCQRYLPAFTGTGNWFGFGIGISSTTAFCTAIFPVATRVAPTGLVVSSASHFSVSDALAINSPATTIAFNSSGTSSALVQAVTAAVVTTSRPTTINATSASAVLYFTGCEL